MDAGDAGSDAGAPPPDAPRLYDARLPDAPPPDNVCAGVHVDTRRTTPNVIVVLDRSGSMTTDFDPGVSRWNAVEAALIGMPDGLVTSLAPAVRFGIVMYSEDVEVLGCPDLATVPAALDNYAAISIEYGWNSPGGNTPTGETLQAVVARLAELAPSRTDPTFILLATDGEPATCADGTDVTTGRSLVVDTVGTAFGMGVRTYVISVGTEIGMSHLQDVANAGMGVAPGAPDAPFWVATDTSGLHDALAAVVTGVVSCTVELVGRIDPAGACRGSVALGADTLMCGTDWRAVDATHIELLGAACSRFQHSTEALMATFPCDVILI